MIYITQLIYLKQGKEAVFQEFENQAIPIIAKHKGELMLRLRPEPEGVIQASIEHPYEIHIVTFPSEQDFESFMNDGERSAFLHLKEESIRTSILVKGQEL